MLISIRTLCSSFGATLKQDSRMEAYFVVFLTVSATSVVVRGFIFTKFLSAKYIVLDPKSIELNYCFVKSYSRTNTVINIGVTLLRTMHGPAYVSSVPISTFSISSNFRRRSSRTTSTERRFRES